MNLYVPPRSSAVTGRGQPAGQGGDGRSLCAGVLQMEQYQHGSCGYVTSHHIGLWQARHSINGGFGAGVVMRRMIPQVTVSGVRMAAAPLERVAADAHVRSFDGRFPGARPGRWGRPAVGTAGARAYVAPLAVAPTYRTNAMMPTAARNCSRAATRGRPFTAAWGPR